MLKSEKAVVEFKKITAEEAREVVKKADQVTSAVGHASTAEVYSEVLGTTIEVNRVPIKLDTDTILLIGGLPIRPAEGKIFTKEEIIFLGLEWWLVRQL